MNNFCCYCVGGKSKYFRRQIKYCNDKYCPFYRDRFMTVSHEDEIEISKKLLGELGVVK